MGLLRTAGKVAVASRVHGNVQRRQRQRWAEQDMGAAAAPAPPPAPVAAPHAAPAPPPAANTSTADMIGLLTQLGSLRDSGVLTDAEFEAQKAQILARASRD